MVITITVNMKMSIKTSITIVIVIVNNNVYYYYHHGWRSHQLNFSRNIFILWQRSHGYKSCVSNTNTTAASSTMTFLFTKFRSLHFLPVKSSRKPSTLVIIIYVYSFGQLLVIYKKSPKMIRANLMQNLFHHLVEG